MDNYAPKPLGIIFDFNGVMVDDFPLQKEAWSQISLKIRNMPVTDYEMIHQIRGVPSKETIKWLSQNKLDNVKVEEIIAQKDKIIENLFTSSPLFCLNTGLETFLNEIVLSHIPHTIATSSTKYIFDFSFNRLNLKRWFDHDQILFNDGSYPGKPAPHPYLLASQKLHLKPSECLVIEDALSGIKSAQAAGVKNIIVIGRDEQLEQFGHLPGVIQAVHNFSELSVKDLFL